MNFPRARRPVLAAIPAWLLSVAAALLQAPDAAAQASPRRGAAAAERASAVADFYARAGREVRSKHYRILSDLPADETRIYAEHLDLIYGEYARRLASLPQQAPEIPFVLMFARERDYLEVLRATYGVNATGSGGMFFITPAGAALAFFTESLPRSRVLHVVQHEGFHQYAHSRFAGKLPPWVNEGLAEFFGEAIVVDGRVIVGQASPGPVHALRKAIEQRQTVDFLRMLTMDLDAWNANVRAGSAGIQYMQAWSMVQFLGWAEGGRHQRAFEGYLRLIHGGTPSDRAFVQAFGTDDVRSFEDAWKAWASTLEPTAFATAASRMTFLAEGMRSLARAGERADSLEDLLARLRARDFSIEVTIHGRTERLTPEDAILDIPKDDLATTKPVFELLPPKPAKSTTAERKREADFPMPPGLTTRGLEPRELVLRWTRTKEGSDFDYELLSPKEAPEPAKERRPAKTPKSAPAKEAGGDDARP